MSDAEIVRLALHDRNSIRDARDHARHLARALGFNPVEIAEVALGVEELGALVVAHIGSATFEFEPLDFPSVGLRLAARCPVADTSAIPLDALRRLMDSVEVASHGDFGSIIEAIKWCG